MSKDLQKRNKKPLSKIGDAPVSDKGLVSDKMKFQLVGVGLPVNAGKMLNI